MNFPYTAWGQTRMIPLVIHYQGKQVGGTQFDAELWVEREEDWYALLSPGLRNKRVRVVTRSQWLQAESDELTQSIMDYVEAMARERKRRSHVNLIDRREV